MQYAKILGTGSYLPANRISNDDLAQKVSTFDEWIATHTGIKSCYIADENEKTSNLVAGSACRALATIGILVDEIDLIIVAITTPDMQFPSTAIIVQHKLDMTNDCPAFNVRAVCTGFMYVLNTTDVCVKSSMVEKVSVIGTETFSRTLDWSDRIICVLFGDGAEVVVLGAADESDIAHDKLQADGGHLDLLNVPGQTANDQICGTPYIRIDGPGVFKFAAKMLTKVTKEVIWGAGTTPDQVDWLVPHQASKHIIESTAKHLGLGMEKVILAVQDHDNTSTASIPLVLDVGIQNGQIQRGHNLLLEGIGGGFAWGVVLLKY